MKLNKKWSLLFLTLILLLGAFFRLWELSSAPPGLYSDEAMNGNNALEAISTGEWKWFYPENNGREALFINIQALSLKIFGNENWALRLISALFGILTILGLYILTKEIFNKKIALFSAFFLAVSFWHILFSRIGFRAIMAPFFLTWALGLLLWASRKNSPTLAAVSGFFFGLGFHSYIAYRAAPLLLLFPLWNLWKKGQKKLIALFLLLSFIAALPLGWYFLNHSQDFFGRTAQISVFSSPTPIKNLLLNTAKTIGMFFVAGDYNWRHNYSASPELWWPVALLALIGLGVSIKRKKYLLFLWVIIMFLPVVVSNEGLPHALRAIILIPPLMIFAGLGLELIIDKVEQWHARQLKHYPESTKQLLRIHKQLTILLFVFFILLTSQTYIKYFDKWAPNLNTYYAFSGRHWDIGQYLKQQPTSLKKYVIVNTSGLAINGVPMPAQTIMFATDTYRQEQQIAKNIFYVLPDKLDSINCNNACLIVSMEPDNVLREQIKKQISGLNLDITPGIEVLIKK